MTLRFDSYEAISYYTDTQGSPNSRDNTLLDSEQSIGEFYFSNVPKGRYLLQFYFQFDTVAFESCGVAQAGPASAIIALGPYVLSYQKINLLSEGVCATARRRKLTSKNSRNNHRDLQGDLSGKGKTGKGGGMSGDHHSASIMPNSDSIAMCYQDASEVIATADVDNDKSDSNQIIINFAEITASKGDDYYGHVLASTFSLFQQHVGYYCEPSQSTFRCDSKRRFRYIWRSYF